MRIKNMPCLALLIALTEEDNRQKVLDRLSKLDHALFYEDLDRFGLGRIEMPRAVNEAHKLISHTMSKITLDRFLVGNGTKRFTPKSFRVQYAPVVWSPREEKPKQVYATSDVEQAIRRFFGEASFKNSSNLNQWIVNGYCLTANKSCISCHKDSKEGELLGYLVYAAALKK